MAERRMFTQKIIDSDAFLDMPLSAQSLYFHLNMRADDDGFLNNPRKIQRMVGASDDDLKLLLAKRFILGFESGVIVIKHWRMHNLLRKDRYSPTQYQEELQSLELKDNGAYTEKNDALATTWQPDGNQMATQYRLGKDSLVKDNNTLAQKSPQKDRKSDLIEERFEVFWKAYPKKKGKGEALKAFKKIAPSEELLQTMLKAIESVKQTEQWKRDNGQFIPYPATWLNQGRWDDENEVEVDKPFSVWDL